MSNNDDLYFKFKQGEVCTDSELSELSGRLEATIMAHNKGQRTVTDDLIIRGARATQYSIAGIQRAREI